MKIITIAGTRPELIRLSEVIKKLDKHFNHIFVHTGQNFTPDLRDHFFKDLDIREPDYQFNLNDQIVGFDYIGKMMAYVEEILKKEKPDRVLILGDTNSCLSAYVCKQMHLPVFHMEAGNRCYDDRVPEETNRRIVDSCSEYLLPYTQRSREQLLAEGYDPQKIIVTGNPITEVLTKKFIDQKIDYQDTLSKFNLQAKQYVLVTLHRTENVTDQETLKKIISALNDIAKKEKIILSVHPKLNSMLKQFKIELSENIIQHPPFGFIEFLTLLKNSKATLSDSGTVPEECCILKIPCVLMRDSTERPELLENNSMILSGIETKNIVDSYYLALNLNIGDLPADYKDLDVSEKIVKIINKPL